jgi:hypothetical protein
MKLKFFGIVIGLFLLSIVALNTPRIMAQGLFGTISGTITDPTGAVVPGATVTVTNINTNVKNVTIANDAGDYSVPNLNPGTYRVEASAKGFKTAQRKDIVLQMDANPKISLTLPIGSTAETVTVTGESAMLETQESSLGSTVDSRQLEQLPVSGGGEGRSPFNMVGLSAGVAQQTGEGGYALDNARLNGGRPRQDDYLVDGTSAQQPTFGGPSINPSVDSIEEMRVQTNNFSAEYGKVSGGVVELTTKSGTNTFHGSAYEYYQTNKLNANSYFNNLDGIALPPSHNDEFGGTVGGRVIKNKLFFFTDYQGIRADATTTATGDVVPNDAFKSGDLSSICTAGFSSGVCNNVAQQLVNPAAGGAPFLNNQVPVSSIAKALEAIYPEGNGGANSAVSGGMNWNGITRNGTTINRFNPRVDWFLGKSDHIFGIYHYQSESFPYSTPGWQDSAGFMNTPDNSVTAGWSHTFGSSLINEFHFGDNSRTPLRSTIGYGQAGDSDFGIQGIPACTLPQSNGKCGPPTIGISGFTGFGAGGSMLSEPAGVVEFLDTVTKIMGRHTVKVGGEIRRAHINNIQPNDVTGGFNFNGNGTGNAFADFLIGYLAKSTVQVQNTYLESRTWSDGLFVQDDWKLTSNLTLNLGLRWQYDPSWREVHHQLVSFNPYTTDFAWTQNGANGAPDGSIETHWKEFAPRLGFAWNPRAGLVVHGGFGVTYPGVLGHGRGGDGNPSPNILSSTQINPGTYIANLPAINLPVLNAPLTAGEAEYSTYTPYHQAPQYSEMWNLSVQEQIGQQSVVSLNYSGSHGVHLPVNYAYNLCQQNQATITQNGIAAIQNGMVDSPYCATGNAAMLGGFYGDYVFPGLWGISSSVYHSLQVAYEKRYSQGLAIQTNFTWSKLLDDSSSDWSGFGSLDVVGQDFYHRSAERSVSAGDVPLRWMISPIYDLPFGPGKTWANHGVLGQIAGGFRISGVYSLTAGDPVGMTDGGYQYCNANMTVGTRPMQIGNPQSGFHRSLHEWFNTDAFDWASTCAYTSNLFDSSTNRYFGEASLAFGNAPRNSTDVRAPRASNLDASIQKEFSLPYVGEQGKLRLQMDAFNLPNHPEFLPPVGTASATFGQITGTRNPGRVIQLGAHLSF